MTLIEMFLMLGVVGVVASVLSIVMYWAWIELGEDSDNSEV